MGVDERRSRRQPGEIMILSRSHSFIFLCNGRTGTTSIEHALGSYDESDGLAFHAPGLWVDKHIPPAVLRAIVPAELWQSCFKFVFVRHPLDWFVSQYRYNLDRSPWQVLAKPWKLRAGLRAWKRAAASRSDHVYGAEDVLRLYRYLRRYRGLPGAPSLLQTNYVLDADGGQIVDFVGRFESLEVDVAHVQQRIGIQFELPHLNRTQHADYQSCFTDAGAEKVRELWSQDFEVLGYDVV
jgi:hypothetical protein